METREEVRGAMGGGEERGAGVFARVAEITKPHVAGLGNGEGTVVREPVGVAGYGSWPVGVRKLHAGLEAVFRIRWSYVRLRDTGSIKVRN